MNNVMKEERARNDMDRSICYMIKENIEQYEKINNCKVDKLKIKVDVTFEGLSKDNEKFSKEKKLYNVRDVNRKIIRILLYR